MSQSNLLRLPEVKKKTLRGRTAIYTDPTFPKPIKIGKRAVAWLESEIDAWIAQRIAESRPSNADLDEFLKNPVIG